MLKGPPSLFGNNKFWFLILTNCIMLYMAWNLEKTSPITPNNRFVSLSCFVFFSQPTILEWLHDVIRLWFMNSLANVEIHVDCISKTVSSHEKLQTISPFCGPQAHPLAYVQCSNMATVAITRPRRPPVKNDPLALCQESARTPRFQENGSHHMSGKSW